jgi:hypothetical protein
MSRRGASSNTKAVQGPALSLESADDVESGDSLGLGVLGVGHGVSDDVWKRGRRGMSAADGEDEEEHREGGRAHSRGKS